MFKKNPEVRDLFFQNPEFVFQNFASFSFSSTFPREALEIVMRDVRGFKRDMVVLLSVGFFSYHRIGYGNLVAANGWHKLEGRSGPDKEKRAYIFSSKTKDKSEVAAEIVKMQSELDHLVVYIGNGSASPILDALAKIDTTTVTMLNCGCDGNDAYLKLLQKPNIKRAHAECEGEVTMPIIYLNYAHGWPDAGSIAVGMR